MNPMHAPRPRGRSLPDPRCLGLLVAVAFASACAGGANAGGGANPSSGGAANARAEVALGGTLFFDTRLSGNDQQSCATCHQPELGFTDRLRFSTGATGTVLSRHTPHLFNIGRNTSFFWDGRATSLEEQAQMVIENPDELDNDLEVLARKLDSVPYYAAAFNHVYPGRGVQKSTITRAIAAFVASIEAPDTPFDRFSAGDSTAMSELAHRGRALFFGSAGCTKCHDGPNFSDDRFHNTGVPGEDRGRAAFDRIGDFQDRPYPFFQTHKAFKTPGLRNVALTAPYFHDGSEDTLLDVVQFYNQGGKERVSAAISPEIRQLGLTDRDMESLVAFLEALTSPLEIERPAIPTELDRYQPTPVSGPTTVSRR